MKCDFLVLSQQSPRITYVLRSDKNLYITPVSSIQFSGSPIKTGVFFAVVFGDKHRLILRLCESGARRNAIFKMVGKKNDVRSRLGKRNLTTAKPKAGRIRDARDVLKQKVSTKVNISATNMLFCAAKTLAFMTVEFKTLLHRL